MILIRRIKPKGINEPKFLFTQSFYNSKITKRKNSSFHKSQKLQNNNTSIEEEEALGDPIYSPTIYALSTAPHKSAIGVIRCSGPSCTQIYKALTKSTKEPTHRRAILRNLYKSLDTNNSKEKEFLDQALILFFQNPNSFTGEDLLELHVHGGIAIINSVLKNIEILHTPQRPIRYAEPGEFSKRAFQNGKFDLTEVEGINEMINAETEFQRISTISSMKGENKQLFNSWRRKLVNNVALLTTIIDFGEDHEIEEIDSIFERVKLEINNLEIEIENYINKINKSEILLKGIKLTLLGPPNAGKSSLLNLLSNSNSAIVSDIAGTTRDIIDIPLDIGGFKVVIGDTAGIRDSNRSKDVIEQEGIKRAKKRSLESDLSIVLLSLTQDGKVNIEQDLLEHIKILLGNSNKLLIVINKFDLIDIGKDKELIKSDIVNYLNGKLNLSDSQVTNLKFQFVSCMSNEGVDELNLSLLELFKEITWSDDSNPISISKRSKDLLKNDVLYGFEEFYNYYEMSDVVLATESLKYSIDGIGKITGQAVGVEEILGVVFSSFCIGK
ncbi:unnamed protein product [[Candida] boidinii]|uniref:Unnamed protein product n=1 Tax=Candida boidinii TaxID=5477 RepID=A0A9W6WGN1_CANBO|nr:hypothetical protein B5S30_g2878 [[Candida] boidinii]GME69679.1 unnamed protein product [[Candida] boidinii]